MNKTISPNLYDFSSYYIINISHWFNAVDEMRSREDFQEKLLESYKNIEFFPMQVFVDDTAQNDYNKKACARENEILSQEIFLACNSTFDRMDDQMRQETLEAVMDKLDIRQKKEYNYLPSTSGFFAYVNELQNFEHEDPRSLEGDITEYISVPPEGSKWYDYIAGSPQYNEVKEYIDTFWINRYRP